MRKFMLLMAMYLLLAGSSFAALTGVKTIGTDYPTLQAAIADLNAQGAGPGGVTFNIPANYTETFTTAQAGYITTLTGSSSNPVIFKKNGTGSNPLITAATGAGTVDAVFALAGCDYVTFDGIDVQENPLNTTATTQMEWGYALLKAGVTEGASNNTIKNCVINLNKNYTATVGIYSGNHLTTDVVQLVITAVTGTNSGQKIFGNTLTAYTGISVNGFNDPNSPYAYYDQNNEIGKDGANIILNVAGQATTSGYGIYAQCQNNLKVANNNITSTMGGTGSAYAIYLTNARNASYDLYNNYISMQFSGTGSTIFNGIWSDMGASGTTNTMNIYNNTITGCTYATHTSSNIYFLYAANLGVNVYAYGNTVTNNTCGSATATSTGRIGYLYFNKQSSTLGPYEIHDNLVSGNTRIQSTAGGGLTYGVAALGNFSQQKFYNNTFTNNIIASNGGAYLLYSYGDGTKLIYNNIVDGVSKAEGTVHCIYNSTSLASGISSIYQNRVQNVEGLGTSLGINGIYNSSSGNTAYIYNNMIGDLRAPNANVAANALAGIFINSGLSAGIYNNTVYLNGTSTGTNFGATGIYITTSVPTDLRNNIIINSSSMNGTGKTTGIRFSNTSLVNFSASSNYNNIYVKPGSYLYYDGASGDQTMAAYQTRMYPREAQSFSEQSPFVNTTSGSIDLHLQSSVATQCEAGGSVISSPIAILTDFDNNARYPNAGYPTNVGFSPQSPDIGADEFGGLAKDLIGPAIIFTPLSNTNVPGTRTLTVTINDGTGVPSSGIGLPVLYWRINSGSYQPSTATYISPNTYSFTLGTGSILLDNVSYYIVAQDLAPTPNISAMPAVGASGLTINPPACTTATSSPNSYTILESISGIKHIGVGKDFATLADAAASINVRWISGPLTLVLDDASYPPETFPVSFLPNPGSSPANTLTIKPNTGVSPVLAATTTTGIINLSGIDYLIIDGSNNGTSSKNLSIKNYSGSSGTYALGVSNYLGDPSTNCTIKNSVLSCKPVNSSIVNITVIKTMSTGGGYNNIVIDNNIIRAGFIGIQVAGLSGNVCSGWQIKNNFIGSDIDSLAISDIGVYLNYADNTLISNNEIMGPVSGSLNTGQTGVYITTGSTNTKVRSNIIHDFYHNSDDGWGATGLWYASDASTVTEISDNVVYNIKAPGINPGVGQNITYGMFFRSGGNVKIIHNTINLTGQYLSTVWDASSACLGFYYQATGGNFEVRDNIFRNGMTYMPGGTTMFGKAYGIMISLAPTMFSVINNNDYYIDGSNGYIGQWYTNGLGISGEYQTLANWQTFTGQEANSLTINPAFTSATNMLPTTTSMPKAGSYVALVPTDITGINRTNPPDIGAYEFSASPLITTTSANSIMNNSATVNGSANANSMNVSLFFDYGTTTAYGNFVAATPGGISGSSLIPMNAGLTGLAPLTTYHFRARGVTSGGLTAYGNDMTFTTLPDLPTVVTTAATSVTASGATLNGTVNANTSNTTVSFEYGLTTSYGNVLAATPSSITGNITTPFSAGISGLLPNTIYHYRAIGINITGTNYGSDMTFTTSAVVATVVTNIASNIAATSAQLNGIVTANNANTTISFQWGLTTSYGNTIAATPSTSNGMSAASVLANLSGLTINTSYHYRCVGVNVAGTAYGQDQVFTTNCVAPVVAIAGPATACAASTGHVYTTQTGNSNYQWVVSAGGTITSGAGTNVITVTWNTAGAQTVSVNYSNSFGCSAAIPTVYNVTVNALPVPTITGQATVCQYSAGNTYTTQAGMSAYTWNISAGGTITSGAGTNTIQVTWNGTGAQTVSVNYNNASGCSATAATVYNVTVNAAPVPTITGTTTLCQNSGYFNYSTEAGMTNYTWTISAGGTIVSGQGTNLIQVTWNTPGTQTLSVNYSNSNGCYASAATTQSVTVNPLPGAAGTITGTPAVCGGTTGVVYSVAPVTNAITYVWNLPAGATVASGAGTNSITVNFASNASSGDITVYGNNLCGNGNSSPVYALTVTPLPADPGAITGMAEICQGTSGVIYSISPITGVSNYNWTVPTGATIVAGNNTNTITVDFGLTAVSGNVTVNGTNSCGNGPVSSMTVTVNTIPTAPVIELTGMILSSSAANGNQWYFEGSAIPGATGQTFDATLNGSGWYWSMVTLNGCPSDSSNHIYVVVTGIGDQETGTFTIFPVPNDGRFTVRMTSEHQSTVQMKVVNSLGVIVYERKLEGTVGTTDFPVDMKQVSAGLYTVVIESGNGKIIKKIIVNK